jgi:glucokinase
MLVPDLSSTDRPGVARPLPASSEPVVGVDVGATSVKALLIDDTGRVAGEHRAPTPQAGPDIAARVLNTVLACVENLAEAASRPPAAIGLAVPGIVDDARGVAVYSENLGWNEAPLRDMLSEHARLPVAFGHDVRVGGLAEARIGAGQGVSSSAFIALGTGIAAALHFDGLPYTGDGFAGELGHTDVGHGEACVCGATGCLEAIASAAAIARRYTERTGHRPAGSREVLELMESGDVIALQVWDDALDALGLALSWLASVLAPEAVILGGGLAEAGDALLRPLAERLGARLTFQPRPRLLRARLGDRAAALGSALLARGLLDPRSPQ